MKYLRLLFLGLFALAFLSACATSGNNQIIYNCYANGAYASGMDDGLAGVKSQADNIADACPAGTNTSALIAAYKQGYAVGIKYQGN